ncbi:MAG: hypothetical protein ACE15E_06540 [Acidobacteriota bacterium]
MNRLNGCLLLMGVALAGAPGACSVGAAPSTPPSSLALLSDDQDRQIDKYNRKLEQLEIKRVRDRQKLDAEFRKTFQQKKPIDLRKLQKRLDEFRRKRDKLEEKYRRELLKLEREGARKG